MKSSNMSVDLQQIEKELAALTANHKPELNIDYARLSGKKFKNNDVDTAGLTIFTEERAKLIYGFMRKVLGTNPYKTQN